MSGGLGVPFPPFAAHLRPDAHPLAIISLLVLAGAAWFAPRLLERPHGRLGFAAALLALSLAIAVAANVARGGVHELWAVFDTGPHGRSEAANEYLPGLWALRHGIASYVHRFPALIPWLPVHVRGNPPGPLVGIWLLGIRGPVGLAALCIGTGSLSAPLAYQLAATLGDEQRGRRAGLLSAFAPSLVLLGATSVDYVFATLGLATACLLVCDQLWLRVAGTAVAVLGAFSSWLLLAIPAWAVFEVLARRGRRAALGLSVLLAVGLLSGWAVLALTLGYDPLAALHATGAAYRHGIASTRPYAFWLIGSPAAFAIALGLPTAWWLGRAISRRDSAAVALAAIVLVAAVLGFTKAETERIWLPFAPLACVAAASVLPTRRVSPALWLLAAQTLAVELLFDTVW